MDGAFGFFGFVVGDLFLFQAYATVGARVSMLVYAFSPAFTAIGSALFMDEHLKPLSIIGMALTLGGIIVVVLHRKNGETAARSQRLLGALFALIASVCQASGYLFSKKAMLFCDPLAATYMRLAVAIPGFGSYCWLRAIPNDLYVRYTTASSLPAFLPRRSSVPS